MRTADGHLSALGKTFLAVVVLVFIAFLSLVAMGIGIWVTLDQSRDNEKHIDCIVASAMDPPPEACVKIIEELREDGILSPPETTP